MKKVIFFLLITSLFSFAQEIQKKSFYLSENKLVNENLLKTEQINLNISQDKKSPALAILLSAVLPGMGELYAGNYNTGKYFTVADVSLWGIYFGMKYYSNLKRNNYIAYAKTFGGVDVTNKNDDYFAVIGEYEDINQYNDDMAFNGEFNQMYDVNTYYFKWNSDDNRVAYRALWTTSQEASNNTRFVVGALIVNRVISIINAIRLVAAYNKSLEQESSWNIYMDCNNNVNNALNLTVNFVQHF
jgi:hypothetical protein